MAERQFLGIKYPFETEDDENYFVDLNRTKRDEVRSQMLHVLFTPKGQKIRDPLFGTDLIKYIFEPNESGTWDAIRTECGEAVRTYVPNVSVNEINVLKNEDDPSECFVRIDYTVKEGNKNITDTVITKI